MKPIILMLACLCTPLAAAPLHKCVGANGSTSYQDTPCPDGRDTAWIRETTPDAAPETATRAAASPPAGRRPRPSTVRSPSKAAISRCEAARRTADDLRDRQWNRLSFKQRSELDDRVARACRRR